VGGSGEGDVYLGKAVTVPPAGTPFLNEAAFGGLSLVADGVRLSVARWEEARGDRVGEVVGACEADQRLVWWGPCCSNTEVPVE
jgi:hypothetical protein